ncbi:head GIN domain-containing protein [Flavobacterium phycosphaerae]|uniref:head GIN domain-containing protein n=1 Tax=Flavobacterium phycosphaerae TaxID=2697515 RepID=UPI00138A08D5|nr:head GIN domain-containing protein [Flavobacterium phycosphaerae]
MKKLVFGLGLISSIAFGQVEKNVGDFTKVTSFDQIDVLLIPGNENKVIIDGSDADDVELINKKGELKIRMPLTKMLGGDNISVTVYFKTINAVEVNEGSRIACGDKIKTNNFDIIAKEGSEVKLILAVSKLNVRVANGSKIYLEGSAQNQEVLVNSGGIYEAETFITKETKITTNAGGVALIYATDLLNAKIRAGGNISIYSKPKQFTKEVIAGGTFNFVEKAK